MQNWDVVVFMNVGSQIRPVGRLRIHEDGRYSRSEFAYGKSWLADPAAFAIDPVQLPLQTGIFRTPADFPLFNAIRDAAPDAWGRKLIDLWKMRTDGVPASEAEYLLISQEGSRAGGLQFGPTPEGPGPILQAHIPSLSATVRSLDNLQHLVDLVLQGEEVPEEVLNHIAPGTDLGGARPKATLTRNGFPCLVKFGCTSDRIPMARVEAACLDLGAIAGLPVAEHDVIDIAGRPALVLDRFDRYVAGDDIHRRHMISGMTLLGAHEYDRATHGYADLHAAFRKFGSTREVRGAGEQIWKRMLMNVLIGNTDDHYRNHAFLSDDTGGYRMSPVYDVTPSLQTSRSRSLFFHLGAAGSGRDATLEAAIAAGPALGLKPERARALAESTAGMVRQNWERVMRGRGVTPDEIAVLANSFSEALDPAQMDSDPLRPE